MKLKRKRLIRVALLPPLFTIGNLLCGFGSLTFAIKNNFLQGAWLILLALVVFDGLDGLIARATKSVSRFGAQLDSLADIVSFGVAPGFLSYEIIHQSSAHLISYKFTFLICAFYVACSALRLARFNVESTSEFAVHHHFTGLPTPAAAGFVASMIILNYEFADAVLSRFVPIALPFTVLILSILMVSRLNYVHLLNKVTQTKHPFIRLAEIILIGLMVAFYPEQGLFAVFLIYVLSTPVVTIYLKLFPSAKPKPGLIMPEKSRIDLPADKTGL